MEIKRNIYLEKLSRRKNNGLVKIVTGVRKCGKSYLLFRLFYQYLLDNGVQEDHIIKVDLNDTRYKDLRSPEKLFAYVEGLIKDKKLYYIILDEVQLLEDSVDVLNGLLHMDNADIYVTGSSSGFLSRNVITEFRGRGDEIHLLPLSFSEFCTAYGGNIHDAWTDYMNYGGLPLVISLKEPAEKEKYLSLLFKKACLADICERHAIRHPDAFHDLIGLLASSVGELTSPLKLADTFKSAKNKKISDVTVTHYIECLEDAFLISRAARYDIRGKKCIGSPFKFYFEDTGLRNAGLNFRQAGEAPAMENIIFNELRYRDFHVDVGILNSLSFYIVITSLQFCQKLLICHCFYIHPIRSLWQC